MNSPQPDIKSDIDITNCDREPIHIPGRVQQFGCLISVTADWIVNHASINAPKMLGLEVADVVGRPLIELFSGEAIHTVRTRLQMLSSEDAVERLFNLKVNEAENSFDVALHMSGRSIVMEFEPSDIDKARDYSGYLRPMIDRIGKARSIKQLTEMAAKQIKAITGLDRVMVYRFDADNSGEVIAEARNANLEPFLNLRYPASDIPQQARALYKRNLLRIIADVSDEGVEIQPVTSPEGEPLDLSMSTTRAVSPIHLEYLRNMGVNASMSISILQRGELWGLFACHHGKPVVLSYQLRTSLELFAQLFAYVLDQFENDLRLEQNVRSQALHDQVMSQLAEGSTISESFDRIIEAVRSVIPFDGVVGWLNGEFRSEGATPSKDEFLALVPLLNTTAAGSIYATESISRYFEDAGEYADRAAGLLALPVSRSPRDYIVFFRREIARSVQWAGNPTKPAEVGPNGIRLTPRKSFEAWKEVVRGHSSEWTEQETQTAEALRMTLLEVVLRMTDASMKERAKAQEMQELLIAELNHRVRNILNLIKGLIKQTKRGSNDIASFTEVIGGRIHALARAHDQITRENWTPASLHELIQTEARAYVSEQTARVIVSGPDALLEPAAFTTISLVVHELMTNSVKYGALSDKSGSVQISLSAKSDGALVIDWTETGGPTVKAPSRRGFGSTIIERSIPYELKGSADVQFEAAGLKATFTVPGTNVASFSEGAAQHLPPESAPETRLPVFERVLVVEDNMIIALDAEMIMADLGSTQVDIAASVGQAQELLQLHQYDFALLDVNLGDQTSEKIADIFVERSQPFVFATGYGELRELEEKYKYVPVVQKPYEKDDLIEAIATFGLGQN